MLLLARSRMVGMETNYREELDKMSLIQEKTNKFIKEKRKEMGELNHDMELGMRIAYAEAAFTFRILGQHEGDQRRTKAIVDALGLIEAEPMG